VETLIGAGVGDGPKFVRRHVLKSKAGARYVQPIGQKGERFLSDFLVRYAFIDQVDQVLPIIHCRIRRRAALPSLGVNRARIATCASRQPTLPSPLGPRT